MTQSKYLPHILLEISIGGQIRRFATADIYDSDHNFYEGTIQDNPTLNDRLKDCFWGTESNQTINITISNRSGKWHEWLQAYELRGSNVTIKYMDPIESTSNPIMAETGGSIDDEESKAIIAEQSTIEILGYGRVTGYDIRDTATLTIATKSMDPLDQMIPAKTVNTVDWPRAVDLGRAVNIIFGNAPNVPLAFIDYQYSGDATGYFDYLIGFGPIMAVGAVYRGDVLVDPSEYHVFDGTQAAPHEGYAFIRFYSPQILADGTNATFTADIYGYWRDFAFAIQQILSNDKWGLGLPVDQNSFAGAKADLAAIGAMYCDGAITTQRKARDLLDELLLLCRGHLSQNGQGQWQLLIDKAASSTAILGMGDNQYDNILEVLQRSTTSSDRAYKEVALQYGRNNRAVRPYCEIRRQVFEFGVEKVYTTDFVQDHDTADRIICYLAHLAEYTDETLVIDVGVAGKRLEKLQVVAIKIPRYSIDGDYRIVDIAKTPGSGRYRLTLKSYSPNIYTYIPGNIPARSSLEAGTDYSRTDPLAPGKLQVVDEGAYQGTNGSTMAYIVIQVQAPDHPNFAKIKFGYRAEGMDEYTLLTGRRLSGQIWRTKIEGLTPGLKYELAAFAENIYGRLSSNNNPTLQKTALDDGRAPDRPTNVNITTSGPNCNVISWTNPSDVDFKGVKLYRGTTTSFGDAVYLASVDGGRGGQMAYPDNGVSADTLYYYWIVAYDFSGNSSQPVQADPSGTTTPSGYTSNEIVTPVVYGGKAAGANLVLSSTKDASNKGEIRLGADGGTALDEQNNVIKMKLGTAPTTNDTDIAKIFVADQAAGNACFATRTESGQVVKWYSEAAISDAETSHSLSATYNKTEIETALNNLGQKINAILTAQRNQGLLAT